MNPKFKLGQQVMVISPDEHCYAHGCNHVQGFTSTITYISSAPGWADPDGNYHFYYKLNGSNNYGEYMLRTPTKIRRVRLPQ